MRSPFGRKPSARIIPGWGRFCTGWATYTIVWNGPTEAEPLLQRALTIQEAGLGPDHPDIANTLEVYGAVLRELGREEEADSLEERAAGIRAASGGWGVGRIRMKSKRCSW